MSAFDRYFHGSYGAARPYALQRLLLTMLALDAWMLMIGHAGRYGTAGFNVAHFDWLDAIIPVPSPDLYIGVLLLSGLLSLVVAFSGVRRLSGGALLVLYTYSWSMSMLDSYQHHYFLSLMLACIVFFPRQRSVDVHPDPDPEDESATAAPLLAEGFGYPLLCVTVAIVYTFTALAKCDALWLDGSTIQRISKAGEVLTGLRALALSAGLSEERFWSLLSLSVIPLELFIAAAYALAPVRDRDGSPWVGRCCTGAAVMALTLHIGAEGMQLEIGWFSYYMMALAVFCLLPLPIVDRLARAFTGPARFFADATAEDAGDEASAPGVTFALAAAVGLVTYQAARMVDLPGAPGAAVVAGLGLIAVAMVAIARQQPLAPRATIVALGAAAVVMWLAISYSDVRWDYYRFRGGDLMRRGQPQEALSTYVRGERYATWMECEDDAQCDRQARSTGLSCRVGQCIDAAGRRVRNSRRHNIDKLKKQLGVE